MARIVNVFVTILYNSLDTMTWEKLSFFWINCRQARSGSVKLRSRLKKDRYSKMEYMIVIMAIIVFGVFAAGVSVS